MIQKSEPHEANIKLIPLDLITTISTCYRYHHFQLFPCIVYKLRLKKLKWLSKNYKFSIIVKLRTCFFNTRS